jgi:hypothetical protein
MRHLVLELLLLLELLELLKVELLLLLLLAKEKSILCRVHLDHALSVTNCRRRERGRRPSVGEFGGEEHGDRQIENVEFSS